MVPSLWRLLLFEEVWFSNMYIKARFYSQKTFFPTYKPLGRLQIPSETICLYAGSNASSTD